MLFWLLAAVLTAVAVSRRSLPAVAIRRATIARGP